MYMDARFNFIQRHIALSCIDFGDAGFMRWSDWMPHHSSFDTVSSGIACCGKSFSSTGKLTFGERSTGFAIDGCAIHN